METEQRDTAGRFVHGHDKLGGRDQGTPNRITADFREALAKSFDKLGREDYLEELATLHPPSYASLIGKVLAGEVKVQIEGSEDGVPLLILKDYTGGKGGTS